MLLLSETRLQGGLDLAGLNDEAFRRVADVRERKARDEREVGVWRRIEYPDIVRIHDERTADFVLELATRSGQPNRVADADPLERAKQAIAMRRKPAVAGLPRQRRVGQVPDGEVERAVVVACLDRRGDVKPRDVEPADQSRWSGTLRAAGRLRIRQRAVQCFVRGG